MFDMRIGVIIDSLGLPWRDALDLVARAGAEGFQMYSTSGEMSPEGLVGDVRKEFVDRVSSLGLRVTALCGDTGRLDNAQSNKTQIERLKRVLELSKELGSGIVTTHIGVVPQNAADDRYKIMQEACHTLAEFADTIDGHFAIETGPEKSDILKNFLDSLESKGVAVNLDPANLVMVAGDKADEAVYNLKDYIVHTHAKDGKMLFYRDPELVYGVRPMSENDENYGKSSYAEVPLGEGDVNFPKYLKALADIGYCGFLTIEREFGEDRYGDIRHAVDFLKKQISSL